jgi:hypothetical protein
MATKGRATRTVQNRGISAKVMEFFAQRPGQIIWLGELAADLQVSEQVAQTAVTNIRAKHPEFPIETVARGRAWAHKPATQEQSSNGKPVRRVFEELAVTKVGELLIQDDKGTVYLAREL